MGERLAQSKPSKVRLIRAWVVPIVAAISIASLTYFGTVGHNDQVVASYQGQVISPSEARERLEKEVRNPRDIALITAIAVGGFAAAVMSELGKTSHRVSEKRKQGRDIKNNNYHCNKNKFIFFRLTK
jgi:hypothetical protein